MPEWIHNRAEHLLAKNPDMKKSTAFAVATQQAESMGKVPKGFGTAEGKRTAKAKFDTPKGDEHKANPGSLESPKMASMLDEFMKISLAQIDKVADAGPVSRPLFVQGARKKALTAGLAELGPAAGAVGGAALAGALDINPLAGAAAGYGVGAIPEIVHAVRKRFFHG